MLSMESIPILRLIVEAGAHREQAHALREAAWATKNEVVRADASGNLEFHRSLEPRSLVLIRQF
jgi:hypothetical protein